MYKYVGNGNWIAGVPARDLSRAEFEALDGDLQEAVKKCGLYELVKTKPAKGGEES